MHTEYFWGLTTERHSKLLQKERGKGGIYRLIFVPYYFSLEQDFPTGIITVHFKQ